MFTRDLQLGRDRTEDQLQGEGKAQIAEEVPMTPDEDFSMASFIAKAVDDGTIVVNGIH